MIRILYLFIGGIHIFFHLIRVQSDKGVLNKHSVSGMQLRSNGSSLGRVNAFETRSSVMDCRLSAQITVVKIRYGCENLDSVNQLKTVFNS